MVLQISRMTGKSVWLINIQSSLTTVFKELVTYFERQATTKPNNIAGFS